MDVDQVVIMPYIIGEYLFTFHQGANQSKIGKSEIDSYQFRWVECCIGLKRVKFFRGNFAVGMFSEVRDSHRGADLENVEAYAALRNVPLFREMDEKHMQRISRQAHFIALEKDQFVFHKGDACKGFYITMQGNIKISFLSMEGKEHVARIVGPGQTFAEAMAFLNKPSPATVQAMTPAKVLFLPSEAIFECISEDPACARSMLAALSRRLHLLVTELESVTLNSSLQRVIGYLLQARNDVTQKEKGEGIMLQASKSVIAAHLNLTPETFSRVLHSLCSEGLISIEGRKIYVHDIEKIRAFGSN